MEITHDYVDLETAKLLREKGFDELCELHWEWGNGDKKHDVKPALFIGGFVNDNGQNRPYRNSELMKPYVENEDLFGEFSAPEHWQVIKWLRLTHSIFIGIELIDNSRETCYQPTIWTMKDREYQDEDCMDQAKSICNWKEWKYSTPEEAELEAIKYCLNNLIDGK